jgi:predicted metalloprotease with PDZ domain
MTACKRSALVALASLCAILFAPWAIAQGVRTAQANPMTVEVDATDVERRIFRVRLTMPARPGRLSLHYPQWIPGKHAVFGPIEQVAGLRFRAAGKDLPWRRDPKDVYRFDLTVPAGASQLEVEFQLATPQAAGTGQNARIVASPRLLNLQWNQVVLYPAGRAAMDVPVRASVRLPVGWRQASALVVEPGGGDAGLVRFETVPLEVLVDSPLFAGPNFASFDLTPAGSAPVRLSVFGDDPAHQKAT